MDVLKDQWSPVLTVATILWSVLSLLHDPEQEDAPENPSERPPQSDPQRQEVFLILFQSFQHSQP